MGQINAGGPPIPISQAPNQGRNPPIDTDRIHAVQGIVTDLTSTRPPPLNLPEPPHPHAWPYKGNWKPSRWDFSYLFKLGKAYGGFYWAGVKQLFRNIKTIYSINRALDGTFPDMAARYAAMPERISYNDYEMMIRTKRDMRKSIPFLLIFAVCGEFTPLVILAFGSKVVPGTCVIPKQVLQDRKKALERDDYFNRQVARMLRESGGVFERMSADRKQMAELYNLIAYSAGLTPFKTLMPVIGDIYYSLRTRRNLARHCDEILSVAALVQREGGWAKKSPEDMWEWGNKYGMYRLRQWTRDAMARDEDPVSQKMKKALLPHFDAEIKSMLGEDFTEIPRASHCMAAFNDPLYKRPDTELRRRAIENIADKADQHTSR